MVQTLVSKILEALKDLGIEKYYINETKTETAECFYVRKKLDLKRRTDTTVYHATVFCPFEKEGKQMLGSSAVLIHPDMEAEEILKTLKGAYQAAAFVSNPSYELVSGRKEDFIPAKGSFAGHSLAENIKLFADALFAPDTKEDVFINSAEFFATRRMEHILNSQGVDVSYETNEVSGEYVVQCVTPQDVETYHHFSYRDADMDSLRKDVEEALEMTKARAEAASAPKAGEYRILLSGEHLRTVLSYYLSRSNSSMIYQQYSNYKVGESVQGENVTGDVLNINLIATDPYSSEGITMKDRPLIKDGVLQTIHGGKRFADYLGIEATGSYGKISVPIGDMPFDEMKKEPYLYIVTFSDFQMDDFSGHFGGEIRLAFLFDGETVRPVTGGSVNGSLLDVQDRLVFSRERYRNGSYEGPLAVSIEGVKVAGE